VPLHGPVAEHGGPERLWDVPQIATFPHPRMTMLLGRQVPVQGEGGKIVMVYVFWETLVDSARWRMDELL
jgi:hypothetical protein